MDLQSPLHISAEAWGSPCMDVLKDWYFIFFLTLIKLIKEHQAWLYQTKVTWLNRFCTMPAATKRHGDTPPWRNMFAISDTKDGVGTTWGKDHLFQCTALLGWVRSIWTALQTNSADACLFSYLTCHRNSAATAF